MNTIIVNHPVALHLITLLRDKNTPPAQFRTIATQLTYFLITEASKTFTTDAITIQTPLTQATGYVLNHSVAIIPILRAGLSMLQPIIDLLPNVHVGYIGLERDETTAKARSYYCKLPDLKHKKTIILDPMLATGGSAIKAIENIKNAGGEAITMISIVASPEGIHAVHEAFPEVSIYTVSIDEGLNDQKYIVPGLGDFGDRLFGT